MARSGRPCSTMAPAIRRRSSPARTMSRGRHGVARATRKASPAGSRQTPAAPGISCRCRPISRTVTSPASPSIPRTRAAEPSTSASTASRDAGSKVPAQASAICGKRRTAAPPGPMSAAICRTCRSTTSCSLAPGLSSLRISVSWSRRTAARHGRGSAGICPTRRRSTCIWVRTTGFTRRHTVAGSGHSRRRSQLADAVG